MFNASSASFCQAKETKINSFAQRFSTDDYRAIYTIGKENINKNKKQRLCQRCSLRYFLAFGLLLLIIFGIAIAVSALVISSTVTTTTTALKTNPTTS